MSPKGPRGPTLGLLLVVTAACLWLPCEGTGYQGFLRKHRGFMERHVDNPKSNFGSNNDYCQQMMRIKGLTCQRSNTFIHTSEEQLRSICNSRGQILKGNVTSRTLFPITICKLRSWRSLFKRQCKYKGKSKISRIRVTCDKGLPVHYISHV